MNTTGISTKFNAGTGMQHRLLSAVYHTGQLTAANIPLHAFNMWFVPITETAVGLLLLYGLFSRIGGLVVIGQMLVATYVHLVVTDPALFPLQPTEPIIPIIAISTAVYVLWRGGGAWSADLKWSHNGHFLPAQYWREAIH